MKQKILEKLLKWWSDVIFVDPCPIPNLYVWEVRVDNKTVHIEASNRMFAFLKAPIKYRHAKHIRVVKLLKINRYA